jgi:hypothetical protein
MKDQNWWQKNQKPQQVEREGFLGDCTKFSAKWTFFPCFSKPLFSEI